jgi:hypothetical protein
VQWIMSCVTTVRYSELFWICFQRRVGYDKVTFFHLFCSFVADGLSAMLHVGVVSKP